MTNLEKRKLRGIRSWTRRAAGAFIVGLSVGACGDLLDVELPGALTEDDLLTPELANTLVLSAIADYECAYAEFAAAVAGIEEVFWESTGWWTRAWAEYSVYATTGSVNTTPCGEVDTGNGFFTPFQSARFQAQQAYEEITVFASESPDLIDNADELRAVAAIYAGFVYDVFGEHWCEMAVDDGPLMTPTETLALGEEWFDEALAIIATTGDFATETTNSVEQLAYIGRARVRFAMGDESGAAADAAMVEPTFEAWVTRDAGTRKRWNQIFQHHTVNKYSTVAPAVDFMGDEVSVGYRNLTIAPDGSQTVDDGVPDPRVPVEDTGELGQDGVTPHWIQTKYPAYDSPIPMATWAEAQLILAEIEGGSGAVDRINALRDVHGLPHVSSADLDVIMEERRREFFYEGRYHAYKLRYGGWFPENEGFNHKGLAYGPTTCLPLSDQERQLNPNIS